MKFASLLFVSFLFVSCGPSKDQDSEVKAIYGTDHRTTLTNRSSPWNTVGKLSSGCTATLIDDRYILTAAHCLIDKSGRTKSGVIFYPNMYEGTYKHSAQVVEALVGTTNYDTYRWSDWAVGKLNEKLGVKYGSMGFKALDAAAISGQTVHHVGYSGRFRYTPGIHQNCKIRFSQNKLVYHNCDTEPGSSGGPLFSAENGKVYILAIHVASPIGPDGGNPRYNRYDDSVANTAVPVSNFFDDMMKYTNRK